MKIAILTLPLHTNYGGILQAYALQTILQDMGHEVEVINYLKETPVKIMAKNACLRLLNKMKGKHEAVAVNLRSYLKHKFMPDSRIKHFISKYIQLSKEKYYTKKDLESLSERGFHAFVIGSDQVWRTAYVRDISVYFLSFLKNQESKRIVYSASFGIDYNEYTSSQIEVCRQYFALFDTVSVRENSGLDLIKAYRWKCKTDCIHTLDPTMLLDGNDYITSLHLNVRTNRPVLFAYVLDVCEDTNNIRRQTALMKELDIVKIESIDTFKIGRKQTMISPVQWLEHIASSRFVVTDSFHGCVFAILFHKPFIIVGNAVRGNARISSLLRLFRLEERFVTSYDDFEKRKMSLLSDIDYQRVDSILERMRKSSLGFLSDSLHS
ncbi:polysaccharide pyruvyl transferase family protein [Bacteroides congonensis]